MPASWCVFLMEILLYLLTVHVHGIQQILENEGICINVKDNFYSVIIEHFHLLQAMFWSGANELVHNVVCVKDDLVTLEDTMPG